MSKTTVAKQSNTQETPKMKKYLVEVEEPKKGQVVSTGGVRDNGKMAAQFKNPIPYEEPSPAPVNKSTGIIPATNARGNYLKTRIREEAQGLAVDVGRDVAFMLWDDFGKPFLKAKLAQAVDWFLSSPKKNTDIESYDIPTRATGEIIDVDAKDLTPVYDSDKVIPFPKKRVG